MNPSVMTWGETRKWLRAIRAGTVRLPRKSGSAPIFVRQPNGGAWRITLHPSGGYAIEAVAASYQLITKDGRPGIHCLVCNRVSYHPRDISERYCGACHVFHNGP